MEFFKSKQLKKFYATLLTIVFAFSLCTPYSAIAQTGTMDTDQPSIIATFTNSTGDEVCGKSLEAGEYNVQLVLKGMSCVSLFQITAYTTNDITVNSMSCIGDDNDEYVVAALENVDNTINVIIFSDNDDNCAISAAGEVMVTLNVTVKRAGDFADYFQLATDPDLTFVQADYGDGEEPSHVHVSNPRTDEDYPNLTFDMSPDLEPAGYTVTGRIEIATSLTGNSSGAGAKLINVSVNNTSISATTDENGYYTLYEVPAGTHTLTISGPSTVDRDVTLTLSGDKTVATVGVVICDYNRDGSINNTDKATFKQSYMNSEPYMYCDFNGDGNVNNTDKASMKVFLYKTISYDEVNL